MPEKKHPSVARLAPVFALLVVVLDQSIKWFAAGMPLGQKVVLVPGLAWFTHVRNTGFSFGLFQGNNFLMICVVIAILGFLIWAYDKFPGKIERVAYWLIIAGLSGNLIDRFLRGSVVDMFAVGWWPVFNIADSAISIAVLLLIYDEIAFYFRKQTKKTKKAES